MPITDPSNNSPFLLTLSSPLVQLFLKTEEQGSRTSGLQITSVGQEVIKTARVNINTVLSI